MKLDYFIYSHDWINFISSKFRESSAIYIMKYLLDEDAKLVVYDPKVSESQMRYELNQISSKETGIHAYLCFIVSVYFFIFESISYKALNFMI